MSTWVCACICFSFVPEMIERMKVWYVIEFWHKCTEGLKNLIRISSIRNNKKYPTIKKIFEAGDFYAILSDIVEKINFFISTEIICTFESMSPSSLSNNFLIICSWGMKRLATLSLGAILLLQQDLRIRISRY